LPADDAVARELLQRLSRALADLKPADRELLHLRNVKQMSYQSIGQTLGIPAATARKRYARILRKLSRALGGWKGSS
jgi:RNA polymerase sigma-70 factor (ECF subfamily)